MSNNDWFKMVYYHVYFVYKDPQRLETMEGIYFNYSKEKLKKAFIVPYLENHPILLYGNFVKPSDIYQIEIFKSVQRFQDLILPNGKSPLHEKNFAYVEECFSSKMVKGVGLCTHDFVTSPPQEKKEVKSLVGLIESATFLGLNTNWSSATCALQLQEVAITLVAKRKNIKLNKANAEKILSKKIEDLSFNDRYEAFSKQVKASFNVEMPILATHLRKMRTKVLHEGYNPKPEETDSIVRFTVGLLKKLEDIS